NILENFPQALVQKLLVRLLLDFDQVRDVQHLFDAGIAASRATAVLNKMSCQLNLTPSVCFNTKTKKSPYAPMWRHNGNSPKSMPKQPMICLIIEDYSLQESAGLQYRQ